MHESPVLRIGAGSRTLCAGRRDQAYVKHLRDEREYRAKRRTTGAPRNSGAAARLTTFGHRPPKVSPMKSSLLILGVAALLITADAVHTASSKGHGNTIRTAPTMPSVTPMPSTTPPGILNQGALGSQPEFGSPAVNSGLIGPAYATTGVWSIARATRIAELRFKCGASVARQSWRPIAVKLSPRASRPR